MSTADKLICNLFQNLASNAWVWLYEVDCSTENWKEDRILRWLYNKYPSCDLNKIIKCYVDDKLRVLSTPLTCDNRVVVTTCGITITDSTPSKFRCTKPLIIKQL